MKKWPFDISADGGKTFTRQWLTIQEAEEERRRGYIVYIRAVLSQLVNFIKEENSN